MAGSSFFAARGTGVEVRGGPQDASSILAPWVS